MATTARLNTPLNPELFRFEAFNGHEGGLATALRALEKLTRLQTFVSRGVSASGDDQCVGDAELVDELATAVECAATHCVALHEKESK